MPILLQHSVYPILNGSFLSELDQTIYNSVGILQINLNVKTSMLNLMATFMNSKETALGIKTGLFCKKMSENPPIPYQFSSVA